MRSLKHYGFTGSAATSLKYGGYIMIVLGKILS